MVTHYNTFCGDNGSCCCSQQETQDSAALLARQWTRLPLKKPILPDLRVFPSALAGPPPHEPVWRAEYGRFARRDEPEFLIEMQVFRLIRLKIGQRFLSIHARAEGT